MIDIQTYRQQIGYFNQCNINYNNFGRGCMNFKKIGQKRSIFRPLVSKRSVFIWFLLFLAILTFFWQKSLFLSIDNKRYVYKLHKMSQTVNNLQQENYLMSSCHSGDNALGYSLSLKLPPNFYAKITYGNKTSCSRGIKSVHLNIRSLKNKLPEVKNIIQHEKPHIFGLSECEVRKTKTFD